MKFLRKQAMVKRGALLYSPVDFTDLSDLPQSVQI